ncbi:MAG: cache domain-containing protein [Burkholderiales bacterium]|nr:cache domain-containing protein [Burkholderiales bacterium]
MKPLLKYVLLALFAISFCQLSLAAKRASKEEAVALVKKAIAEYKSQGREKALAAISEPNGKFHDRELFVVTLDAQGTVIAHSVLKEMMGANLLQFHDANNIYMVKDMMDKAKQKNSGWSVEYLFLNPVSKKMEKKLSYFEKYDDLLFFCGVYK